jgi:hypothetical protein
MPSTRWLDGDASTMETATTTTDSTDFDVGMERRNVRLTDRKLVEMAVQTADAVDWDELVRIGDISSGSGDGSGAFEAVVAKTDTKTSVTACGAVLGSVAEMRSVLRSPTSEAYASTMREMYGQDFIYGTIAHRVRSNGSPGNDPEHSIRQRRVGVMVTTNTADVDVRTVTFAKRHWLARSEQWCFVDALHALEIGGEDGDQGFAASMTSLHPDDVFLGKTKASVDAYTNVNVTHTVRPYSDKSDDASIEKANRSRVQVVFYAEFDSAKLSASRPRHMLSAMERMHYWRNTSERALVRRLTEMAANLQQLERIIRRRRLSAQVFVDERVMMQPNTRCSCCTKMLTTILGRNKKQCHLCGFYVCEQCSRQHEIERGRVKNFLVRICEHCLERVDEGIYDNLPSNDVSSPIVIPDEQAGSSAKPKALTQVLHDALLGSSELHKPAVKSIIRTMTDLDTPTSSDGSSAGLLEDSSSDDEYFDALRRLSNQHPQDWSADAFALANALTRTYPTQYKADAGPEALPEPPIPDDEEQRLQWVQKTNVSELKNLPELELICDMARKELGCEAGLVTVATRDEFHVLASNVPSFQNFVNTRDNAVCAHVLMNNELPLLLEHPEADVRFNRQNVVREFGARFYFGFPLTASDGTAIGTVCCLDSQSHTVTQSQYKTMERFARSASRLVQHHAGDK